jgi:succinoglycan biosynthesis transport protein ExoP
MYRLPPAHMPPSPRLPANNGDFLFQELEAGNLRDYWVIILKYRWSIATFILLAILIAAISMLGTPRVYTGTATLFFENPPSNVMSIPEVSALTYEKDVFASYFVTQLDLLKSRRLVAQVIQNVGLDQDQHFQTYVKGPPVLEDYLGLVMRSAVWWALDTSFMKWIQERFAAFRKEEGKREEEKSATFAFGVHPDLIDGYLEKLEISPGEESQLVKVRFSSLVPSLSKEVVNTHITAFIRANLRTRFEETAEAQQFLQAKLTELKISLERSEADLSRFRKAHAIVTMEQGQNLVMEQLRALNADLVQARSKKIELESIVRAVQKRDNQALSQVVDNPLIQRLKEQIAVLETERARLATIFRGQHPEVSALQSQVAAAKARLEQEINRVILSITSDYNAAKGKEQALTEAMEAQRRAAMDLREKAVEASILEGEVEANRKLYENVLRRTKETGMAGEGPTSNIRVVDHAETPLRPDDRKVMRTLLLSVLVGLLSGVGLAFLRHYLDNTLNTPEDIGRFTHLPTLGMVPDIRRLDKQMLALGSVQQGSLTRSSSKGLIGEKPELVISYLPLSLVRESYQTICTALLFSLPERPPRSILITSSQPREGKTATAVNIAITLAQSGAPILLIDADLRNGHCHRLLSLGNESGLTNILTGDENVTEIIQKTSVPNLSLLSRGAVPPNPAQLLGSESMRQLLSSLERDFSFIIIDSAPLLPISDTVLLSTTVEGVLLVVKAQEASRHAVNQACERLAYVKAKVLGVILNGINIQHTEYKDYRSSYISYYAGYATDHS